MYKVDENLTRQFFGTGHVEGSRAFARYRTIEEDKSLVDILG